MAWLDASQAAGAASYTREDRFLFRGAMTRFMNRQTGIWKPAGFEAALSISTTYTPPGGRRPYDDIMFGPDGMARYKWRGTNPDHADNRALRAALRLSLPLIWFIGSTRGRYAAEYPVYLVKEEPDQHQFAVLVNSPIPFGTTDLVYPAKEIEVAYAMRETRQRLHQAPFRAAVLDAYQCRCAVCRFGHVPLLDAAHIVADSDGGSARVSNGLALCKMHHGAYDSGIIGITPNLIVEVNPRILEERDGPMLVHGIQEFHEQRLMTLPYRKADWPDPEALRSRYELFLTAK